MQSIKEFRRTTRTAIPSSIGERCHGEIYVHFGCLLGGLSDMGIWISAWSAIIYRTFLAPATAACVSVSSLSLSLPHSSAGSLWKKTTIFSCLYKENDLKKSSYSVKNTVYQWLFIWTFQYEITQSIYSVSLCSVNSSSSYQPLNIFTLTVT